MIQKDDIVVIKHWVDSIVKAFKEGEFVPRAKVVDDQALLKETSKIPEGFKYVTPKHYTSFLEGIQNKMPEPLSLNMSAKVKQKVCRAMKELGVTVYSTSYSMLHYYVPEWYENYQKSVLVPAVGKEVARVKEINKSANQAGNPFAEERADPSSSGKTVPPLPNELAQKIFKSLGEISLDTPQQKEAFTTIVTKYPIGDEALEKKLKMDTNGRWKNTRDNISKLIRHFEAKAKEGQDKYTISR